MYHARKTYTECVFQDAKAFKSDISKWDVSRVIKMNDMFKNAVAFNGDLSRWDVSRVTTMRAMFSEATVFGGDPTW